MLKKLVISVILLIALVLCVFGFAGCSEPKQSVTVTLVDSMTGNEIGNVNIPFDKHLHKKGTYYKGLIDIENPTKEGWFFDGWYLDEECLNKVVESCDTSYELEKDIKIYAGWSDYIEVPYNDGEGITHPLINEIFDIDVKFGWIEGLPQMARFYGSIVPKRDISGELTDDEITFIFRQTWYNGESFLGELVNPGEVVAGVCEGVTIKRSENYTLTDFEVVFDVSNQEERLNSNSGMLINTYTEMFTQVAYSLNSKTNSSYVTVQYKH